MLKTMGNLLEQGFETVDLEKPLREYLLFDNNIAYIGNSEDLTLDEDFNAVKYHSTNKFTSIKIDGIDILDKNVIKERKNTYQIYESELELNNVQREILSDRFEKPLLEYGEINGALTFRAGFLSANSENIDDETSKNIESLNHSLKKFVSEVLGGQILSTLFCFSAFCGHSNPIAFAADTYENIFSQIENKYLPTFRVETSDLLIIGGSIASGVFAAETFHMTITTQKDSKKEVPTQNIRFNTPTKEDG
jgi:hypothetical protein